MVPFDLGQANAINPCQQADEVLMPIFTLDRANRLSRFGRHDPSELQVKVAGCKKPEAYSLQYVEDFLGPRTTQMPADRLPQ